ncbi:MAG: hypothetical protein ACI9P5_002898 [Saprospiraceae bacterium]|jgi:hypothetical protein
MQNRVIKLLFSVFSAIWMIVIFTEYWRYNPNYSKALDLFQYYDLLIIFVGLGAAVSLFLLKTRHKRINYLNGLSAFLPLLVLDILAVSRFTAKISGIDFTLKGLFSHLAHIIGVSICLFIVYLVVRVLGGVLVTIFPPKISKSDLPLIQVSLGIMTLTLFMFFLGLLGLLNAFVLVPICIVVLALYWRHTFHYFKETLLKPIEIPKQLSVVGIFSFLFLAIFLILNFVQILRPFPIGSDSLRLYVNLPSLIADYGGLVDGYQPYSWSLFMSIGKVIFGRIDVVLGISFLGGFLALFALFRLSRKWLDINYSALVLLLFYSLPMTSFLSYMDMKIDMGLLFITLCILLLFYNWIAPDKKENTVEIEKGAGLLKAKTFFRNRIPNVLMQNRILVLIGLLAGFAFSIKFTFLFFFLALYCAIWFFKGGRLTFIASFFLCFAVIFLFRLDAQTGLRQFHQNVGVLQWGLLLIGIALLAYIYIKQKKKLQEVISYSLIIGSFFLLPVLPWIGKNFSETGKVTVTSLLNGKMASPVINIGNQQNNASEERVIIPGLYQMPDAVETSEQSETSEKTNNRRNQKKRKANNAVSEDLHRFMGYEVNPIRYLSIPYDVFINSNIAGVFTDVGFLLFLLFPILFLFAGGNSFDWKSMTAKIVFLAMAIFLLIVSIPSAFLNSNNLTRSEEGLALLSSSESHGFLGKISDVINRTLLNVYDPINEWLLANYTFGEQATYPLLILLFLLILTIVFARMRRHSELTQSFILFILMYFFLWWILGSGASWYGILIFGVPIIFLLKSISFEVERDSKMISKFNIFGSAKKYVFISTGVVWVLLSFIYRSSNYEPIDEQRAANLYYPSILNYQMGNLNEKKLMDYHFPNVRQLVRPINNDKKSLVYMVGSPYSFFIDKNDSRVLSDTYLDFFEQLIQKHKTKNQVISVLKSKGFKYIIFDLNMASYDVTPGKTLTGKFTQFLNTLYANPGVELMATDRKIKLYDTGVEVFDVFQGKGEIVKSGNIGIFEIK